MCLIVDRLLGVLNRIGIQTVGYEDDLAILAKGAQKEVVGKGGSQGNRKVVQR